MEQLDIIIKNVSHRGNTIILFLFDYNAILIKRLKKLGCRYSATYKGWYMLFNMKEYNNIKDKLSGYCLIEQFSKPKIKTLKHKNIITVSNQINQFTTKLQAANYSPSSVKTYVGFMAAFLKSIPSIKISAAHVQDYLSTHLYKKGYSASTMRQFTAAIKLYAKLMEIDNIHIDAIKYPRKSKPLPKVLSHDEIKQLIAETNNLKHKAIVSTLYSTGMRRSEILNLRINHINGNRNTIHIINSKGNKDRIIPLSSFLKKLLREYYIQYRPKDYLFEGTNGAAYSASSINQILKKVAFRAKIRISVSAHILRHSYATHLLENGTNLRYIQELLGHKSSRTTEIYTKVSNTSLQNIKNPLDVLYEVSSQDNLPF